jgi:hypothetical protein
MFDGILPRSIMVTESSFNPCLGHLAYVRCGSVVRSGRIGPDNGSCLAQSRELALVRSYAEAIERRAAMIGAGGNGQTASSIDTFDLVSLSPSNLPRQHGALSDKPPFVSDTTGTCAHPTSSCAVGGALRELLEKNALFLMWYGLRAQRVEISDLSGRSIVPRLRGVRHRAFVTHVFRPLYVVLWVMEDDGGRLTYGTGARCDIYGAIHHAVNEALLLGMPNRTWHSAASSHSAGVQRLRDQARHVDLLDKLETCHLASCPSHRDNIDVLRQAIPSFVRSVHVMWIPQTRDTGLKVARCFSPELYATVPVKAFLDLERAINIQTLALNGQSLASIADCPYV